PRAGRPSFGLALGPADGRAGADALDAPGRRDGVLLAGRLLGPTDGLTPVPGEEPDHLLPCDRERHALRHEHLAADAFALPNQAEQDVLGPDVVVAELEGLAERELEDLLRPRRERDVPGRLLVPGADHVEHLGPNLLQVEPERDEGPSGQPLALLDQA